MRNKKVLFFTFGKENVASSRIRVYDYLIRLKGAGFDYSLISYTSFWHHRAIIKGEYNCLIKILNKIYGWISLLRLIFKARNFDIIFIQRVFISKPVFKIICRLNPNIIFDFDDAIYGVDYYCQDKEKGIALSKRLNYILKNSKCVITTQSEYNQAYAKAINKNVIGLPSPVDIKRYLPLEKNKSNQVVVGWIGSPDTTYYLYALKSVFYEISKKYPNLKIELIGARRFEVDSVDLVFKDWDLASEVKNLANFDIGIMPLEDDVWSRNKYYKLLQYLAMGMPAVVSSVGVCRDIVRDGVNGFLVKDKEEWINRLSLLIEDFSLRERMGRQARETAEGSYSYEIIAPRFIETFQDLCGNGKSKG